MKNHLLIKTMLLLCALVVGSNYMWATDVTYTITSATAVSTSGTAPQGSSATFVNTYTSNKAQMTSGNSQTLTLSGFDGYKITKLVMRMKSNTSSGSGKLSYSTDGGTSFTYLVGSSDSGVAFNNAAWNGAWSTDLTNVTKDNLNISCTSSNLVIKIEATANSLFCESYSITYEASTSPNASLSATSLAFGRVKANQSKDLTFTVTPSNLTGNLSIASNNAKYTVTPTSIAQSTTTATTITVTAAPTATSDDMSGTITISGGGLAQNKTVSLSCVVRDPSANDGTAAKPYTVAEALVLIDEDGSDKSNMHVAGIVSQVDSYNSTYKSITYWISDDGTTTDQLEVYSGKGISGANFSAVTDVKLGDEVVVKGNLKKHNYIYEFEQNNQLVSQEHATTPIINANNVTIEHDATSGEIAYTIDNPTSATLAAAITNGDWISNVQVDGVNSKVTFSATANMGVQRTATITLSYTDAIDRVVTITQKKRDYATLPFAWYGGTRSELAEVFGVTTNGLGTDYAAGNGAYRVKFDSDNDYIQIKTNEAPEVVYLGIKNFNAIGASAGTKITIKGSADGISFTNIEEFDLNGFAADIHNLKTTNDIASGVRYVRIIFTKGSGENAQAVAVGPIYLNIPEPTAPVVSGSTVTLSTTSNMAGWRTYDNNTAKKYTVDGTTKVYYASATGDSKVTLTEIEGGVPANTTVILHQTSGTTITLTETDDAITAPASNLLAVSTANQNLGTVYRLGYKAANGIGFYTYTSASAPAGIIYIASVNAAREFLAFAFDDEEVTGISDALRLNDKGEMTNDSVFDLQGRRVANPTRGLYIVNGKKVIVK